MEPKDLIGKTIAEAGGRMERLVMCVDSCFDCMNFHLCYMRRGMEDQIRTGINMLNIDGVDRQCGSQRPGQYADIYIALGSACKEFKRSSS